MSELWTWLQEALAVPAVQALAVVLAGLVLARVVDFVITRGLARLVRRGLGGASRARALSAIRHFHRFLLREGIVGQVEMGEVVSPRKRRRVPGVLTMRCE